MKSSSNPGINADKSTYQLREIHVSSLTNPSNNLEKSIYQFWQIQVTAQNPVPKNQEIGLKTKIIYKDFNVSLFFTKPLPPRTQQKLGSDRV